jgi:hypothetical protein
MNEKKCLHCKEKFIPANGNAKYCSAEHNKFARQLRQNKIYGLIKGFKKGYYNNYKVFTKLLPNNGSKSFSILKAKEMGFDESAFYGIVKDKDGWDWYCVSDYFFTIKSQEQELKIYKSV